MPEEEVQYTTKADCPESSSRVLVDSVRRNVDARPVHSSLASQLSAVCERVLYLERRFAKYDIFLFRMTFKLYAI